MRNHNYPKNRKTPVKHRVKAHKRQGNPVRSFMRGEGQRRSRPSYVTKRKLEKPRAEAFTVNFTYSSKSGEGESVVVFAPKGDYQRALDEAFEEKSDPRDPVEIEIIDPSIGSVLKVIGSGLKKAGKIGADYAIKGGHVAKQASVKGLKLGGRIAKATGKVAAEYAVKGLKSAAERGKVTTLLHLAYSKNRNIRTQARGKLLKDYPSVYDVCDFSKDRPLVSGKKTGITIDFKPEISPKMTQKISQARSPSEIRKIVRTEIRRQAEERARELAKIHKLTPAQEKDIAKEAEKRTKVPERMSVEYWEKRLLKERRGRWADKSQKTEADRYESKMFEDEAKRSREKAGGGDKH